MKEAQIRRMNFLRRGGGGFTYKHAVYVLVGWLVILGGIYALQFVQYLSVKAEVKATKAKISSLIKEKDEQVEKVKKMSRVRKGLSAQESLEAILRERPRWSKIIRGIARALPPDVWLRSVEVGASPEGNWYTILIKGKAKTQRSLTNFILKMESSGLFVKTALGKTKSDGKVINYELSTEPVRKKLISDA